MSKQPPSNADVSTQELIVAYLDGELSPAEAAQVEKRLAEDGAFRQRLKQLEQAWAALDELPVTTVDDRFSRTTMELVVTAAEKEVQEQTAAMPVVKRKRRISNWLLAAAAALVGFAMFRLAWTSPNRQLREYLPAVMHVDAYTQFREIEFLQQLAKQEELPADFTEEEQLEVESEAAQLASFADMSARKTYLASLDKQQRTDLRYKAIRFRELSLEEQERIVELQQAVAEQGLEPTLIAYEAWLDGLSESKQYELRQISDPIERAKTVGRWLAESRKDAKFALNDEQLRQVVKATDEIAKLHRRMLAQGRTSSSIEKLKRLGAFLEKSQNLLQTLPEEVRSEYQALSLRDKVAQVFFWRRQAMALKGGVSEAELERFFAEELPVDKREQLLSLSPEDMQRRLREMYHHQTGTGFDGPEFEGPWRGPEGRGPQGRGPHDRGPQNARDQEGFGSPERGPRGPRGDFQRPEQRPFDRPPRDFQERDGRRGPPPRPGER
ncbi:MAG: zf-HC2 domain-containing protein [Lacipirellulaceae bacterium]